MINQTLIIANDQGILQKAKNLVMNIQEIILHNDTVYTLNSDAKTFMVSLKIYIDKWQNLSSQDPACCQYTYEHIR